MFISIVGLFSGFFFSRHLRIAIVVAFTAENDAAFYPVGRTIHPTNPGLPGAFDKPLTPAKLFSYYPMVY